MMKLTEETPIFKLIAEREHEFYLGNIKENIKQKIIENQEKLEKIKEYLPKILARKEVDNDIIIPSRNEIYNELKEILDEDFTKGESK